MAKIVYEIAPSADQWSLSRNGEKAMNYVTAEAAFEVAVAKASIEMRSDNEVVIAVRPPAGKGGERLSADRY
jgi:hypothetical protein